MISLKKTNGFEYHVLALVRLMFFPNRLVVTVHFTHGDARANYVILSFLDIHVRL